jgi:hypothetical protein
VIVNTPDASNPLSVAEAEHMLYMKTSRQFHDCSNGAMELVKKDDTIEITLPNNIGDYSQSTISSALFQKICEVLHTTPKPLASDAMGVGISSAKGSSCACDFRKRREQLSYQVMGKSTAFALWSLGRQGLGTIK